MAKKLSDRIIELEDALAMRSYDFHHAQRRANYLYDRLRKLENAVRDAAEDSSPYTPAELLVNLARKVPRHPRARR